MNAFHSFPVAIGLKSMNIRFDRPNCTCTGTSCTFANVLCRIGRYATKSIHVQNRRQNTLRWVDADFSGNYRFRNSLLFSHSNKGITEFTTSLSTANLLCLFFTVTQAHHSII